MRPCRSQTSEDTALDTRRRGDRALCSGTRRTVPWHRLAMCFVSTAFMPIKPCVSTGDSPRSNRRPPRIRSSAMRPTALYVVAGLELTRSCAGARTPRFLADYDYDAAARCREALWLRYNARTGTSAGDARNKGRAYAFAQSGAPLSQYVAYAQHACALYHPQRLVVNVVGNDFDESVFEHRGRNGLFHLYPQADGSFDYKLTPLSTAGLIQRVLRQSALALYLARNVGMSGSTGSGRLRRRPTPSGPAGSSVTPRRPPTPRGSTRANASSPGRSRRCRKPLACRRATSSSWSMPCGLRSMTTTRWPRPAPATSAGCGRS